MAKDVRELIASRAFWLLLLVVGLLVGHAFLTATESFAEMSGSGGPVVLSGLSPLDGILVPTFGAYDIAATFLLPFVVIRLFAAERQSGALRILLQSGAKRSTLVGSKVGALLACWLVAMIPGFVALAMWRIAGGHLNAREVSIVVLGHLTLAAITIGVAAAASGFARSSASAAIVALSFTLGTWALDFIGAVKGGILMTLARYTPSAVVRTFEHGELRLATLGIAIVTASTGVALGAIMLDLGASRASLARRSLSVLGLAGVAIIAFGGFRFSWDFAEDKRNSFNAADEMALGTISQRLRVEVHLGGEDPRRTELEREVLMKLRRVMHVDVEYVEGGGTGMLSRANHYGEMMYSMGAKSDTTRSVTAATVLDMVYHLAGVTPPATAGEDPPYHGYPLAKPPGSIVTVFFIVWPLLLLGSWWTVARPRSRL